MDCRNINEDEIDTEALQAQIDLSMSFAQNLVSSWVKPSRKLSNRNRDVEAELKEYMRRPPRLGVGAPIPETQSFSRETARLKGQLTGKGTKRSRDDEEVVKRGKAESSDEESRAGAIKKKVRLDPFGDGNGKKKRKKQVATNDSTGSASASPSVAGPTDIEMSEQAEVLGMVTEADPMDAQDAAVSSAQTPIHNSSATSAKPTSTSFNYIDNANRNTLDVSRSPNALQVVDISLTATPVLSPNRRSLLFQTAEIFKQPVLNLDPPSSDDDSDQETGPEASTAPSPKKKRKRRKRRKKHHQLADVTTMATSNKTI